MRYNYPKKALAPLFRQRGVALIQHRADKFEFRFQAPPGEAVFTCVVAMLFGALVVALCLGGVLLLSQGNRSTFLFGNVFYACVTGVCLFFALKFFRNRVASRLFSNFQSRGLVCDASLLSFTVWSRLYETPKSKHIAFREVADVIVVRGNRLALATRDGFVFPFTRRIADSNVAETLRSFVKNLATLDNTSHTPHWQETAPSSSADSMTLREKRNDSTPLRFSKRANRKAPKLANKRYFTPGDS